MEAHVQTREEGPTRAQFSKAGNQKRFFPEERERAFPVFLTTKAEAGRKALDHGDMRPCRHVLAAPPSVLIREKDTLILSDKPPKYSNKSID